MKDKIKDLICKEISNSKAEIISVEKYLIVFKGNLFKYNGKRRSLFDYISKGCISLKSQENMIIVLYSFEFYGMFISATVMSLLLTISMIIINGTKAIVLIDFFAFIVWIVWFFGATVSITLLRFNMLMRRLFSGVLK